METTTDNAKKRLLFKPAAHRNTTVYTGNELSQMQKDLIKAKDSNITVKPMKINNKNTISIDSTKTEKS